MTDIEYLDTLNIFFVKLNRKVSPSVSHVDHKSLLNAREFGFEFCTPVCWGPIHCTYIFFMQKTHIHVLSQNMYSMYIDSVNYTHN